MTVMGLLRKCMVLCVLVCLTGLFCQGLSLHTTNTSPKNNNSNNNKLQGVLLARQIKQCNKDTECALELLDNSSEHDDDDAPWIAAMEVCGKARNHNLALDIYKRYPTERCRTLAISICGKCGEANKALQLLQHDDDDVPPQAASWNAAIAACCGARYWKEALDILENRMPPSMVSTLTCNAVLTCLCKANQGNKALDLLNKMKNKDQYYAPPDRISYHHTLKALVQSDEVDDALQLLQEMEQENSTVSPSKQTYNVVAGALEKKGDWDRALAVDQQCGSLARDCYFQHFFQHWQDGQGLVKVGTGKEAYWKVGDYTNVGIHITVAFQTNRNPSKNGIKMLFYDKDVKIGFLLMINSLSENTSTLLGMYLAPEQRQRGLSKMVLASWLRFCVHAGIRPTTCTIQKPLLALVLQHGFGFVPRAKMGVEAEISPGKEDGAIVLYSPSKSLRGAFSPWDLASQNIVLATTPTRPRGRKVRVQTKFESPDTSELEYRIEQALQGKSGNGHLDYKATSKELRRIFLGV